MKENFKILAQFIKDMSSETPDIQSYMFVKENITKYQLNIDIRNKVITREEALEHIHRDGQVDKKVMQEFCEYLEISEEKYNLFSSGERAGCAVEYSSLLKGSSFMLVQLFSPERVAL